MKQIAKVLDIIVGRPANMCVVIKNNNKISLYGHINVSLYEIKEA